ncbi:class III lanthionine synthetase LanKC [Rossellomorea marisflavi]|uniref:class III lanthionine synthetase LanKC n=1 Tax=Rossellomorea marisflavi TaxID=189381 RepID=UPI00345A68A8
MTIYTSRFHQQFLPFDKKFYENLSEYIPNYELLTLARSQIPLEKWKVKRSNLWFYAHPDGVELPLQGWKIHISATIENYKEILKKSVEYLVANSIPFKFLVDKLSLKFMNSKLQNRGSSGKFITVYPQNEEHFKEIIIGLYRILEGFSGPYILSDKRYKDCKVLYYRYGGIKANLKLNFKGEMDYVLVSPDGNHIMDPRYAYWNPPYWIKSDPFDKEELVSDSEGQVAINDRYLIEKALSFSVTGGVYLAWDVKTNKKVILKEARPFTHNEENNGDAISRLEKEFEILEELKGLNLVPEPLEKFYAWEHMFIAIEYFEGVELAGHITSNNPLIRKGASSERIRKYTKDLLNIWKQLSHYIKKIHERNIIIGDLSLKNILISETGHPFNLMIIDLEGAWRENFDKPSLLSTPGFIPSLEKIDKDKTRDIFALGALMLGSLFPINSFLALDPTAKERFAYEICKDLDLPSKVLELILKCLSENPEERPDIDWIINTLNSINVSEFVKMEVGYQFKEYSESFLKEKITRINKSIIKTGDPLRKDRLFPSDPIVYYTNPLSVAYGACGVLYSLNIIGSPIPQEFKSWLLHQPISHETYTPGLYVGLSGIAWTLLELEEIDFAKNLMNSALSHPLLYKSPNVFYGAAGVGLTCLKFFIKTKERHWLNKAKEIGDFLLNTRIEVEGEEECHWKETEKQTWLGYPRGNSGISLFLLYLHKLTENIEYYNVAFKGLVYEISKLEYTEEKTYTVRRGALESQEQVLTHYWIDGSAGVLTTLIRFWYVNKDDYLKNIMEKLLLDVSRKYTAFPNLFRGLAGLGNVLIDAYQFTGNEKYLSEAKNVSQGIELYEVVENNNYILYPGEQLFRFSTDFGTGAAGINLFLDRLVNNKLNFNFTLDEIILNKDGEHSEVAEKEKVNI